MAAALQLVPSPFTKQVLLLSWNRFLNFHRRHPFIFPFYFLCFVPQSRKNNQRVRKKKKVKMRENHEIEKTAMKHHKCNQCSYTSTRAIVWRLTRKYTVVKSPTNATNAIIQPCQPAIWEGIWRHTVEKSHSSVTSVIIQPHKQEIWKLILRHIVEKNHTSVISAIIQPYKQSIWEIIWTYTMEKSQTNVPSVIIQPY